MDRQTDGQTDKETYTEDVGENVELLCSVESCGLSDRPSVWVSEVNNAETHVTKCH